MNANEQTISTLRNQLKDNKCQIDDENIVSIAKANARIARELRDLRGHKELFTTTTTKQN